MPRAAQPQQMGDKVVNGMISSLLIFVGLMDMFQCFTAMDRVRESAAKRRMLKVVVNNRGPMMMLVVSRDFQYVVRAVC